MSDSNDTKKTEPTRVSRREALKKIAAAAALPVAASTVASGCIIPSYSDYSDYFNYYDYYYYYYTYTNYYVVYTNYYY